MDLATIQLGEAMPQIEAGKVAPLLVFSEERNTFLPDTPTAKEAGYDVPVAQYRAVAAPKGTPQEVKDKLVAAFQEAFKSDAYKEFNKKNMLTPKEISGAEVVTEWKAYAAKYKALVEKYDISLSGTSDSCEGTHAYPPEAAAHRCLRGTPPIHSRRRPDDLTPEQLAAQWEEEKPPAAGALANAASSLVVLGVGVGAVILSLAMGLGTPASPAARPLAVHHQLRDGGPGSLPADRRPAQPGRGEVHPHVHGAR